MFEQVISAIKPLDSEAMEKCQLRLDNLTKPLGSLNYFEELVRKIAGITRNPRPRVLPKSLIIMAGSKGEAEMRTAVNVFASHVSAAVVKVDIGTAVRASESHNSKITKAIEAGIKAAHKETNKGVRVLGLGDMGANSIAAGTAIVEHYTAKAESAGSLSIKDHIDILSQADSYEIAGLVGVILGAASGGAAVVLDGLATSAAALVAVHIVPDVREYLVGSHFSVEPAHRTALDSLGIKAYLHLDIEAGDGTGAALGISLINASLHVLNDMKTFGDAEVAVAQDGPGASRQSKDVKDTTID